MRYIRFYGDAGYAGTSYEEVYAFSDDTLDGEIDAMSVEIAEDNAEDYEYTEYGWGNSFENEDERDDYYTNALGNCGWEEISEEEYNAIS